MARSPVDLGREPGMLLDITSYARRGPTRRDRLSPQEVAALTRTARRTPEVVVKVSGGAKTGPGVLAHLQYIDRNGRLEIETDQSEILQGNEVKETLVGDWQLDLLAAESRSPYRGIPGRKPGKLVHKVVLSMPAGTPPTKLLAASREFAREEFALKHRYAVVLHTDQDHPHVHLVIKAVSEDGRRLNIRKATLRGWRQQFAALLRAQGIAANATERAVRGQVRGPVRDGIYRAALRGQSTHHRARLQRIVQAARSGEIAHEPGAAKLQETRRTVVQGWHAVAGRALDDGLPHLAQDIWKLIGGMQPPRTDDERLRSKWAARVDADRRRGRDAPCR
jgi:hypothetical protein